MSCAAFESSKVKSLVLSTILVKQTGQSISFTNAGLVSMTINGLIAETNYTVYCCTEDYGGNIMEFEVTKSSSVHLFTLCCKSIVFKSYPKQLQENSADIIPFSFSLDSSPYYDETIINIQTRAVSCSNTSIVMSTTALPQIVPSSIIIPSNKLSCSFVVKGAAGCYRLTAIDNSVGSSRFSSS